MVLVCLVGAESAGSLMDAPHHPGPAELVGDFLGSSHEILPGKLWQTSAVGALIESLGSDEPTYVISCIHGPEPPGLAGFLRFPFEDKADMPNVAALRAVGEMGARWMRLGRVIVHCLAGNNRSGLVCGEILHADCPGGLDGDGIVEIIQAANPHALYNETFRKYLESL